MTIKKTVPAGLSLLVLCLSAHNAMAQSSSSPSSFVGSRSNALGDVMVTAARIDRDSETPSAVLGVITISGDEIRQSGFSNLAEAIEKIGQVRAVSSLTGDGNRVVDLGSYGTTAFSNTAVYLDDIRLSQVDGSAASLNTIPVELIERIEIISGGQSVAYGEGTTGGVVRIVTRRDEKRPLSGTVTAGMGSYSGRELRASVNGHSGAFGFFASAAQDESKGYREGTSIQNKNGSVGINWREGGYRASFLASAESADSDYPGASSVEQFKANPRQRGGFFTSTKLDSQIYDINLARQQGDQLVSFDASRRDRGGDVTAFGSTRDIRSRQDSGILKFKDTFSAFNHAVQVSAGLEQRDSDYSFFNTVQQLNRAAFGSVSGRLFDAWTVAMGARAERVEKNKPGGEQLDASAQARELSIGKSLTDVLAFQYRYSEDFRIANADEEGAFALAVGTDFLKIQTTRSHQVLLTCKSDEQLTQSLRLFQSVGENEIAYDSVNFVNTNLDPTKRQGIEHRLGWTVTPVWQLKTRVGFVSARFRQGPFAGNDVPLVPARQASVNVIWKPVDGQRVEGFVTAASSSRDGNDFSNTMTEVPGYAIADVRYVRQFSTTTLTLALNNVFDRSYFTQSFFGVYPENGRNFRVTLRQSF